MEGWKYLSLSAFWSLVGFNSALSIVKLWVKWNNGNRVFLRQVILPPVRAAKLGFSSALLNGLIVHKIKMDEALAMLWYLTRCRSRICWICQPSRSGMGPCSK